MSDQGDVTQHTEPNEEPAAARSELVKSITDRVLEQVKESVAGGGLVVRQQRNRVLPHIQNNNYRAQLEFLNRISDLLEDPAIIESAPLKQIRKLVQRRSTTLVSGDSDYSVFALLEKFERNEALLEGGVEDEFLSVLRAHEEKSTANEKKKRRSEEGESSSSAKRPAFATGYGGSPGFGGAQFGFAPFMPPPPPPFVYRHQPVSGYRPTSSRNCYNCNKPGHIARNCQEARRN